MKLRRSILIVFLLTIVMFFTSCLAGNYKVTFDSNGGSAVEEQYVPLNELVDEPSDPTKEGFEFVGWYYKDELYDFSKPVDRNFKLVAKWEEVIVEVQMVKVTFISNEVEVAVQNIELGSKAFEVETPVLEGHYFAGWYNGEVLYDFEQAVNTDVTLVAKWESAITMDMVAGSYEGIEDMSGMELASYKLKINADGSSTIIEKTTTTERITK